MLPFKCWQRVVRTVMPLTDDNNVGSVKLFFERTSPFAPKSVFTVLFFGRASTTTACL
jgi:hypothetical protein